MDSFASKCSVISVGGSPPRVTLLPQEHLATSEDTSGYQLAGRRLLVSSSRNHRCYSASDSAQGGHHKRE